MWQHHYLLHVARMDALRAKAERERRWHIQDAENGRRARAEAPGRARVVLARLLVAGSRIGERLARRLDERVAIELGPERLVRDA
jgi:hypothetical protein